MEALPVGNKRASLLSVSVADGNEVHIAHPGEHRAQSHGVLSGIYSTDGEDFCFESNPVTRSNSETYPAVQLKNLLKLFRALRAVLRAMCYGYVSGAGRWELMLAALPVSWQPLAC
jgi:hypothetical protein